MAHMNKQASIVSLFPLFFLQNEHLESVSVHVVDSRFHQPLAHKNYATWQQLCQPLHTLKVVDVHRSATLIFHFIFPDK